MSAQFTAYKHANDCFIVVLQSLPDTISNLGRPGVVDMYHAKFRMNRALVVDIYHRDTKEKKTSVTSMHDSNFVYTVGQIVSEPRYDPDQSEVCTQGIHFFLTEEAAYHFGYIECLTPENGVVKSWSDNGRLEYEVHYKDA